MTTTVNLRTPGIQINSGKYKVKLNGDEYEVNIEHMKNYENLKNLTGIGVSVSGSGSVEFGDDHLNGIADVLDVTIIFPEKYDIEPLDPIMLMKSTDEISKHVEELKKKCLICINRVIEVIRASTNHYWITELALRDIYIQKITVNPKNGKSHWFSAMKGSGIEIVQIPMSSQANKIKQIDKFLKDEIYTPVEQHLFLDALNYFSLTRYNESIIAANISLELTATRRLYEILSSKHGEIDAKNMLSASLKTKKFNRFMDIEFKKHTDQSLADDASLFEGLGRIRTIRKNTIHPQTKKISKEECMYTISTIHKIFLWIINCH